MILELVSRGRGWEGIYEGDYSPVWRIPFRHDTSSASNSLTRFTSVTRGSSTSLVSVSLTRFLFMSHLSRRRLRWM